MHILQIISLPQNITVTVVMYFLIATLLFSANWFSDYRFRYRNENMTKLFEWLDIHHNQQFTPNLYVN